MSLTRKLLKREAAASCQFSIIVVAYDMARELPRTLKSLSRDYQLDCKDIDYEVLVVDNGSPTPIDESMVKSHGNEFRLLQIENPLPSPGAAINQAVQAARGSHIGIIVDGARMLTPGAIHWAWQAFRLKPRCVASVLGFHLGPEHQSDSSQKEYKQDSEDKLLQRIRWPEDGYRLFEIPALAGEGCFHQIHGGVTTGGGEQTVARYDNLQHAYREIRGEEYKALRNTPILLGYSKPTASFLAREGARTMVNKIGLEQGRNSHVEAAGLNG